MNIDMISFLTVDSKNPTDFRVFEFLESPSASLNPDFTDLVHIVNHQRTKGRVNIHPCPTFWS